MATEVFINIKDLPEVTEISNGDYILLETSTGTHIIDFQNFIVPPSNTVLTTTVTQNSNAVVTLSALVNTHSNTINTLSSNLDLLTSSVNGVSSAYIGKVKITIPAGGTYETGMIIPNNTEIKAEDVIITPANAYAARFPAYVMGVSNGAVKISAPFSRYTFVAETNSIVMTSINAEEEAMYNVMAIISV